MRRTHLRRMELQEARVRSHAKRGSVAEQCRGNRWPANRIKLTESWVQVAEGSRLPEAVEPAGACSLERKRLVGFYVL